VAHAWIWLSVFAALMQAVRTAAQKTLNQRMSTLGTTYVRSLVGLPILALYLVLVLWHTDEGALPAIPLYYLYTFGGAATQVVATFLLITLFRLKNYAVGTMLTKVDIVMTALIGSVLFSERITASGMTALLVVLAGVLLLTAGKTGFATLKAGAAEGGLFATIFSKPTQVALACALLFTFSYLFLREATLLLRPHGSAAWAGAWTVVVATGMQTVALGAWLAWKEPSVFSLIWPNRRIVGFIGLTSALGSIGWYTAFALQNASYVRAVGQIEVVFTLLVSWLYFRERLTALEYTGMAVTVAGVLMFRLVG
jgi:drug/metabolite transporter (DMT)-like permease